MPKTNAPTHTTIDRVIGKHLDRLRKPGVLTVRPGHEIAKHQLTGKSAIVATVHTKKAKSRISRNELLPERIGKIPVDVREATALQRLRAHDPASAALVQAYGRPEQREPVWPLEREMPSGKLLASTTSETQKLLARQVAQQPAVSTALQAHASKPQLNYVPANVPLQTATTTTTITAHVSPDAGLVTLQGYLKGTNHSLVVGMYDFTSAPILNTFLSVLGAPKTLQMVLDNPAPNETRNQTDWQTVQELNKNIGARAKIARALVRSDPFAAKWMFPYAYHIKVIVRDNNTFWLSSGNLNNSNQPDLSAPPTTEDRDWHVIIEDAALAKTFLAFLNQDYLSAAADQAPNPDNIERAIENAQAKHAAEANPPPPTAQTKSTSPRKAQSALVAAKTFRNINVKITPLLTPDSVPNTNQGQYLTNIVKLISSATKSLYIQLQYIESSSGSGDYDNLLKAIADRVKTGVDVRLIENARWGEKWAENMKSVGVDLTANIRMQPNVHNKGFVVDSRTVVVSSQNFSPAGVRDNRDAGVIIESPEIAAYFEPIFLDDWNNQAIPFDPRAAKKLPKSPPRKN